MATGTIEKVTPTKGGNNPFYCKLPDGTMMQWGSTGQYSSGATATYTITLGEPFYDSGYYVVANSAYFSEAGSYEGTVCTVKITDKSHFDVHVRNVTNTYTNALRWFAVGRWK